MKISSLPRPVARQCYVAAIEHVLARLRAEPAVRYVYQVGGIRTPGISDVDLLVVFRDGVTCRLDPRDGLDADGRYVFAHTQFGLPERFLPDALRLGFFHDYKLLWGEPSAIAVEGLAAADGATVHRQTGLEYLLKMFISMTVDSTFGVVRVRNLLLLGRALRYDLQYVGATDGPVEKLVDEITAWREVWFTAPPPAADVLRWFAQLRQELEALLSTLLLRKPLYLPEWADGQIALNIAIGPADRLQVQRRGVALPAVLAALGPRIFNLQRRFNRFSFGLPITDVGPEILARRHERVAAMLAYNREHLPNFQPAPLGLNIFSRRTQS
jgi:hypothetical protein